MLPQTPRINRLQLMLSRPVLSAALIIFLLSVSGAARGGMDESAEPSGTERTLTVSGRGKVLVAPDIAYMTLGVVTEDADAHLAQQRNAEHMGRVVAQLKTSGIPQEDIKTVSFTIQPRYRHDRETGESTLDGYTVNNSVQVTVRDLSKTGDMIDRASRYGMNISGGISFGLSDYETHYRSALKEAGAMASGRANALAESLGLALKGPVSVTEQGGGQPAPRPLARGLAAMAESYATPVESGTITVEADVTVVYEF